LLSLAASGNPPAPGSLSSPAHQGETQNENAELERLLEVLPLPVRQALQPPECRDQLLEVVLDLGRVPEARYPSRAVALGTVPIERTDLAGVLERLGPFGGDNRAGIERTLHRISALRNRRGEVVGLTCRVGRAVFGTVAMVRDLLDSGESLLLMGPPGVGKTTALREIARVLADELNRRVVVIDTSNEIAGDGDIPHPAIGRARRMQVAQPELQHQVMIEAVENHMPEVIVIDEIGTAAEAMAARTIAERGVMLVATAHGNALANLIKNPTLSDLVGGIESVTLGDEEARRRRTQKTVLERAAEPTFSQAVEMHSRHRWVVHQQVAATVDQLLRGQTPRPQIRELQADGQWCLQESAPEPPGSNGASGSSGEIVPPRRPGSRRPLAAVPLPDPTAQSPHHRSIDEPMAEPTAAAAGAIEPVQLRLCGLGLAPARLQEVIRARQLPVQLVADVEQAEVVLSLRGQLGRDPELRRRAQAAGRPILVIKSDSPHLIQRALERLLARSGRDETTSQAAAAQPSEASDGTSGAPARALEDGHAALEECRLAVERMVLPEGRPVELLPRSERVRQMQAELVGRYRLRCAVFGKGNQQRLRVFPA
jgi:stage III sporulation protein SpoIIIAA